MQGEKKKILMLCDHPLSTSGVGTQARWLINGLIETGKYSFRVFGGAVKHDNYNIIKVNDDFIVKPTDGFGNREMLRHALATEKPDCILLFTDPRFFIWVWEMEDEVHQVCPIAYNHLWDNPPWPEFNRVLYESTDLVNCINYPTYEMVHERFPEKTNYIPHGVPPNVYRKLPDNEIDMWRTKLVGKDKKDHFIAMYVGRNARRKMPSDILKSWKMFLGDLEKKHGHRNGMLVMHTNPKDPEGPNLVHVIDMFHLHDNVLFSNTLIDFPQMNALYNAVDVVVNRSCFAAGTKVTTRNEGYKNIEDVKVGDYVLTHKGRWKPVTQTIVNPPPGRALRIRVAGMDSFVVTHNHGLFAIKRSDLPKKYLINENLDDFVKRPTKVSASELQVGDYVACFIPKRDTQTNITYDMYDVASRANLTHFIKANNHRLISTHNMRNDYDHGKRYVTLDENLAYILGEFVGDGCSNSALVSFNKNDDNLIDCYAMKLENVFGLKRNIMFRKKHIDVTTHNSVIIAAFFKELCGEYSHGKRIPEDIMNAPDNIKRAFLDGYVAADGCYLADQQKRTAPVWRIRTVSNKLAQQTRELLLSLGIAPRVHHNDNSHGYNKQGKIWTIEWNDVVSHGEKFNGSCRSWVHDGISVARIQKIEEIEIDEPVYNLTVDEDHTYVVENVSVFNCNEGFGLPILEAKMTETPCISIKTGGLTRQIEDHETGEHFGVAMDPDVQCMVGNQMVPYIYEDFITHQHMADAFMTMYEKTPEERAELGKRCHEHAVKNYSLEHVVKRWDETLSKLFETWDASKHERWRHVEL